MMTKKELVKIASAPEYYEKYGIQPDKVAIKEDGMHTDGESGNYEWWYADINFDDGSNLVITFHTKPFTSPQLPLAPMVSIDFNGADGKNISKMFNGQASDFSASTEKCDVKIGKNEFKGNLNSYTIHVEIEDLVADVVMTKMIPSWRPSTGHVLYGAEEQYEYGWLVAIPKGQVTANIQYAGQQKSYQGVGYHDHNWGNKNLIGLKHHGFWGRAEVDGYTFINAINYAPKEYGKQNFTMFMLAKGDEIIADDESKVTFSSSNEFIDEVTNKPIAKNISYLYDDGDKKYKISYEIENVILQMRMINVLPPEQQAAMKAQQMDPAYLRFTGITTLEIFDHDELTEKHSGNAIWESMYFGNPEDF